MSAPGPTAPTREQRLALRRAWALERTKAAVSALSRKGVTAVLTGSLAAGDFHEASDVDLLIVDCPRSHKYAIEADVEDALEGLPFDVIYLADVRRSSLRESLLGKAVDVRDLC